MWKNWPVAQKIALIGLGIAVLGTTASWLSASAGWLKVPEFRVWLGLDSSVPSPLPMPTSNKRNLQFTIQIQPFAISSSGNASNYVAAVWIDGKFVGQVTTESNQNTPHSITIPLVSTEGHTHTYKLNVTKYQYVADQKRLIKEIGRRGELPISDGDVFEVGWWEADPALHKANSETN